MAPFMAGLLGLDWKPRAAAAPATGARGYTDEEDAIVAARLRALGYLE
jgi:hypothetical protein